MKLRRIALSATVQPVIATSDLDRLLRFYTELFGAVPFLRVPDDGPVFYLGLSVGNSELGLAVNNDVEVGTSGRVLLSIDVPSVDALLERVPAAGGTVLGPPNDMPWGQRVAHISDPDGNDVNLTQPI
jgi:predicted enzyme related to lactoylglutathione lyase